MHEIRVRSVQVLIQLVQDKHFSQDWLQDCLSQSLKASASDGKFQQRINTLFAINEVHPHLSTKFLNDHIYGEYMKLLACDPVPNIRFNYAKTAVQVYKLLSNSNKMHCSDTLKTMATSDADFDVMFFAAKALEQTSGEQVQIGI